MKAVFLSFCVFFVIVQTVNATKSPYDDRLLHLTYLPVDEAPCNDGTPAGFYFREGFGSGANRWVIRLQGGGWCWDVESCKQRWKNSPKYMSNKFLAPTMNDTVTIVGSKHGGILSSNATINPDFYNANQVYLWYCTSDSHAGTRNASPETNGWVFRGKDVVKSLINHLLNVQTPSIRTATEVLLTGDSAGGVGTISNADYVYELLKPIQSSIKYKAFVDAGWFLDIPSYNDTSFTFRMCAQDLLSNWHVIYNQDCMDHYKGEEWKCFHAQYAYPFIKTDTIYHEFQTDAANNGFDGIHDLNNPVQLEFVKKFRITMDTLLKSQTQVFSPNCYKHEVEDTDLFNSIHINGKTFATVLGDWFFSRSSQLRYVDTCTDINCNPDCPK